MWVWERLETGGKVKSQDEAPHSSLKESLVNLKGCWNNRKGCETMPTLSQGFYHFCLWRAAMCDLGTAQLASLICDRCAAAVRRNRHGVLWQLGKICSALFLCFLSKCHWFYLQPHGASMAFLFYRSILILYHITSNCSLMLSFSSWSYKLLHKVTLRASYIYLFLIIIIPAHQQQLNKDQVWRVRTVASKACDVKCTHC